MSDLKTKPNNQSVKKFLNLVKDVKKRHDAEVILALMEKVTKEKARMWGDSMIGFGSYHYKGKSGREGDWPMTAFSPRTQNLTIYIMPGFKNYTDLLKKLGPHKTSVSCLYLKNLNKINLVVLKKIISDSFKYMKKTYH